VHSHANSIALRFSWLRTLYKRAFVGWDRHG
jgi:hypothetical protein